VGAGTIVAIVLNGWFLSWFFYSVLAIILHCIDTDSYVFDDVYLDNEEHNWIFSANQLVDETAGKGLEQLAWYLQKNSFVSSILALYFVTYFFLQKGKILNGISLKIHQVQLVIQMGIMTSLVQCLR